MLLIVSGNLLSRILDVLRQSRIDTQMTMPAAFCINLVEIMQCTLIFPIEVVQVEAALFCFENMDSLSYELLDEKLIQFFFSVSLEP